MGKVLVGLWSPDTHKPREFLAHSVFPFTQAVKRTREKAASLGLQPEQGKLKSIFVAPEFLFTSATRYQSGSTGMEKYQKDWVLSKIAKVSQDSPSMLLIPGTIVFKEPLTQKSVAGAIRNLDHAIKPVQVRETEKSKPIGT